MNPPASPVGCQAFTRVELLAVLAVGTVVLATALPAVSSTRVRSGSAACAANQKHLAAAMALYAGDNADALAPTQSWRNGAGTVVNLVGGGYWAEVTPTISSSTPLPEAMERVRTALTNGPLWAYASDEAVHHCPSDARFELRPGRGWAFDSYSKVNGMAGVPNFNVNQRPFQRFSDIPEPSRSFLFVEESDPRGQNQGTWLLNTSSPSWVDPVAVWHDTGANSVHADGHLEYHRWTDPATITAARRGDQGRPGFNWAGGNASNPDFRWVWDRYRHLDWKPLAP